MADELISTPVSEQSPESEVVEPAISTPAVEAVPEPPPPLPIQEEAVVSAPDPIAEVANEQTIPPSSNAPALESPAQAGASQPVPPLASSSFIKDLLIKAREKIQFRKRRKLDKIMDLASKQASVANDDVERLLRISDKTATRYLVALVKERKLRQIGVGRAIRYEKI